MYTDSHAHYDLKHFNNNRWSLLAECRRRGIGAILVPAIRPESNDTMMQTLDVETYPELLPQLDAEGVRPEELPGNFTMRRASIPPASGTAQRKTTVGGNRRSGRLPEKKKVAAIGETGLALSRGTDAGDERTARWNGFTGQLRIGEELELPLVLHIRMADDDAISILKRYPLRQSGVVHCFNGGWETAREYLNLGSVSWRGGSITLEPYRASVGEALKEGAAGSPSDGDGCSVCQAFMVYGSGEYVPRDTGAGAGTGGDQRDPAGGGGAGDDGRFFGLFTESGADIRPWKIALTVSCSYVNVIFIMRNLKTVKNENA